MPASYLSYSAAAILHAVRNGYRYGFDIMDALGLPSGTVYPALRRMESAGLIVSRWEKPQIAQQDARPARKYYELTRAGEAAAVDAAGRYRFPARTAASTRPARSTE